MARYEGYLVREAGTASYDERQLCFMTHKTAILARQLIWHPHSPTNGAHGARSPRTALHLESETLMTYNVGNYLLDRLAELGVNHLFGVPGDFN